MDAVCFREGARLMVGKQDHLLEDAMIAATARIHGLIVATRNDADFASLDVPVVNPFRGDGCWARVWRRLVPRVMVPRVIDQRHGEK